MKKIPSEHPIRLLVIDDSAFMRSAISMMIRDTDDIEVVGQGKNGEDAIDLVQKLNPDIITMDIEMPKMDGLTALGIIMKDYPTPVIMISSLTTEGAESTLKAFELGAVDFISKEMSFVNVDITKIKNDLFSKLRHFGKNKKSLTKSLLKHRSLTIDSIETKTKQFQFKKIQDKKAISNESCGVAEVETEKSKAFQNLEKMVQKNSNTRKRDQQKYKLLCIGTSTGGPIALQRLIPHLPSDFPIPIVIVQHMPPNFTKSLALRLDTVSELTVKEAEKGEEMKAGHVYIAPGGKHLTILKEGTTLKVHLSESPYGLFHKPSIDVMLFSVANFCKENVLSVILTGMGKDGFEGIKRLKAKGSYVIAEEESSCIVYGMPKVVIEGGYADEALALENISSALLEAVR